MAPKKEKKLDVATLQKMHEPLTVRVQRVKSNLKTTIALPGKEGPEAPPGTGWTRDDVLGLESYVQNLAGGGFYVGEVTDASGTSMTWEFGWDPRTIPERIPPGDQAHAAMPPPAPVPGQPPMVPQDPLRAAAALGGGSLGWLPPVQPYPYQQQQGQPQQSAMPWWYHQMPAGFAPQAPTPATPWQGAAQGADERVRFLENQLREQQFAATMKDQQSEVAQAINVMREEMRQLAAVKAPGEDAEARRLREENMRLQQEQARKDAEMRMQSQIDRLAQMMEKVIDGGGSNKELERLQAQMERDRQDARHREEMRALKESKPDALIEFFRANSQQQAETAREIARSHRETANQIAQTTINPMQMADLMQRQSGGMDNMMKSVIGSFGGAFETYRMMMESLVQIQGGGQSPGMTMLQEGIGRATEIANQYLAFQRDKSVHESQAKAAAAKAQAKSADAMRVQAETISRGVHTGPGQHVGDPALAGATSDEVQPGDEAAESSGNGQSGEAVPAEVIDINEGRRPTEQDMFGAAFESVQHLRQGVAENKMDPMQAASAIVQGIAVCEQQNLVIPAFTLFAEGRFADLMDALLPEAPQQFRDECVQILVAEFMQGDDDEGDDDQPEAP
jgi:hypothetical protein